MAELNASGTAKHTAEAKRNEELALIRKADLTLVVSPFEKELLESLEPDFGDAPLDATDHWAAGIGLCLSGTRGLAD